ncbi:CPBP family intramembrane metalloprotease [Candidatus Thorarchaeota archaeon]|nr:MAG: CPBP family intramembrane metalloprotease [Candidatus Thorarchaeota archaeon]
MIDWVTSVVIGILAVMLLYQVAFLAVRRLVRGDPTQSDGSQSLWRTSLFTSPIIGGAAILLILVLGRADPGSWGLRFLGLENAVTVTVTGLVASSVVTAAQVWVDARRESTVMEVDIKDNLPVFVVSIVFLASIAEELMFRGFLQQFIDNALLFASSTSGLVITAGGVVSALLFGLVHAMPAKITGQSVPMMVTSAFILGLLAAVSLASTGSILAPIIVHMEFNIMGAVWEYRRK